MHCVIDQLYIASYMTIWPRAFFIAIYRRYNQLNIQLQLLGKIILIRLPIAIAIQLAIFQTKFQLHPSYSWSTMRILCFTYQVNVRLYGTNLYSIMILHFYPICRQLATYHQKYIQVLDIQQLKPYEEIKLHGSLFIQLQLYTFAILRNKPPLASQLKLNHGNRQ